MSKTEEFTHGKNNKELLKKLRILFVHVGWSIPALQFYNDLIARLVSKGYQIEGFCSVPNPPAPVPSFQEIDLLWKSRDKSIRRLHKRLIEKAKNFDILINFNGAGIHPSWLEELPTFNVYICFDDPESSEIYSKPVAKYFDYSFTGNTACVPLYQSWGIKRCSFLPLACYETEYNHSITRNQILNEDRDIDIVFFGERESKWRKHRLDQLHRSFPDAVMLGRGWKEGFVPSTTKLAYYSRAKIGWNVHNSVGPVNLRTFSLPANGIMQICDNKCRLGQLFKLNEEVIGYDTIEECMELTRYYLAHEDIRREIAVAGYERVMRDYTEEKQMERILDTVGHLIDVKHTGQLKTLRYRYKKEKVLSTSKSFVGKVMLYGSKKIVNRMGMRVTSELEPEELERTDVEKEFQVLPYKENTEVGPSNLIEKNSRTKKGELFEWPNIVALNWAVAAIVGDVTNILELGGGTGCFAFEASADPDRFIVCSELEKEAYNWAKAHRSRPNIKYMNKIPQPEDCSFDIVIAIDVIEHIKDYRSFLDFCSRCATRAIFTTPNKNRNYKTSITNPPEYYQHVREWTAGEFYWVLRSFYKSVYLYSMPDQYVPRIVPVEIVTRKTPLIGVCDNPYINFAST